jgi:elongator complex protein 3
MSGVTVVAIMTKPAWCPGECTYCPTSAIAAKSYTGYEPAARRARANDFDSHRQVSCRLDQFIANGHHPSKCELIIMGGTFNSLPEDYQRGFLKGAYDAFNQSESDSLEHAMLANESADHRVVGLVVETRPDWAQPEQVRQLLGWGMTKIELGVQSLDDAVLELTKRGHGVAESKRAAKTCKDAFLKVGFHLMLGLHSTPELEMQQLPKVFSDSALRPDMLKIYPALVIPGTPLHEQWLKGEFVPYTLEDVVKVVCEIKRNCPPYTRIMRINRDIPTPQIAAGVKNTNLREIVQQYMVGQGWKCRCIRCREAGLSSYKQGKPLDLQGLQLRRLDYESSGAKEVFLSYELEEEDLLAGFIRLRSPPEDTVDWHSIGPAVSPQTAGVRELRVYGEQVEVGSTLVGAAQHRHLGSTLLKEAEQIAKEEWDAKKIVVTAGVGVREYYRKFGYTNDGPYVSKPL